MTNAILHISDLHFVADYERAGNSRFSDSYQMCFLKYLDIELKKNDLKLKFVIISGDISDTGEEREFNEVLLFLNSLCDRFSLDKTNFVIVPGNHDISWNKLKLHIDGIEKANRHEPSTY